MATLQTDEANILDVEATNWRLIVYPILAVLVAVVGGLSYYFYLQNARETLEASARAELVAAKTPEELIKVADKYPGADQATIALLSAADGAFAKRDYDGAIKNYQRIIQTPTTNADLRDPAQIGLASALEAAGKTDDAISAYRVVAELGLKSPFAPYAYSSMARIYEERGDKDNERKVLTEAASLDPDSPFVKQAQFKLKQMNAAEQPPLTVPVPGTNTAPVPAPAPTAPAPTPAPAATPAAK
jgi:tetratricopeptide (TPR) repeat protein